MLRFRLRTLLILLAVGPPILAVIWGQATNLTEFVVILAAVTALVSVTGVMIAGERRV